MNQVRHGLDPIMALDPGRFNSGKPDIDRPSPAPQSTIPARTTQLSTHPFPKARLLGAAMSPSIPLMPPLILILRPSGGLMFI